MELLVLTHENVARYVGQILDIEMRSFRSPWGIDSFIEQIELPFSHIWCMKEEMVLSYCCFWKVLDELHLLKFATHPLYRKRGLGTKLMEYLFSYAVANGAVRIDLEVRSSNKEAIDFYLRNGFKKVGMRKNYYTHPKEDAILMSRFNELNCPRMGETKHLQEVRIWQ